MKRYQTDELWQGMLWTWRRYGIGHTSRLFFQAVPTGQPLRDNLKRLARAEARTERRQTEDLGPLFTPPGAAEEVLL